MLFSTDEQEVKEGRLNAYRNTAYKYGIAAVVLALNNAGAAFLFVLAARLFFAALGIPYEKGTPVYYFTILLLNALSAYVFPMLLLSSLFKKERQAYSPDLSYRSTPFELILLFLAGIFAGSLGSIVTSTVNDILNSLFGVEKLSDPIMRSAPTNAFELTVFFIFICAVAPVCEEFIFRDLLLKPLRQFSDTAAVLVSGLMFGLYHGNFDQFAYAALSGVFYAVIAVRANSVIPSMIFHFLNNTAVACAKYLPCALPEAQPFSDAVSTVLGCGIPVGIGALAVTLALGGLRLHPREEHLSKSEKARYFIGSPAVLIGLAALAAGLFI